MIKQGKTTGLPRKLTQKENVSGQANQNSPTKRKAKATGKRTGGSPTHKLQTSGMRLQTDIPTGTSKADPNIQQKPAPVTQTMTTNHQSSRRISHHRLRGKIEKEHHPQFQGYHSGCQLGTANRRCSPRLETPYQLMSSMIKTMKKRKLYNLKSIRHRTNRTQTTTRA